VWWANESNQLSDRHRALIEQHRDSGLGVSVISCWEVCKLVEKRRLRLANDLADWVAEAVALTDVVILPLTPEITIESTRLPPPFHADPADQLIVATARILNTSLLTADRQLIDYPGVPTL
jgi:PIN domain nuclease of toxin-antitoxin system